MIATQDYVERKFREFNELIFNSTLPPLPVRLSKARTFLGQLRYRRKRKFFGGWKYDSFQLVISNRRDMDESLLEDTIIHEMIHYSILSSQLQDTSAHGKIFRGMMHDINTRYGRNISISHTPTAEEKDIEKRKHFICVSHFTDGRVGITLAAKSRLFLLWDAMSCIPQVEQYQWYLSTDPFFNRFRRSITPKVYRVDREELALHLGDALPLVREEKSIKVSKKR
ncbi:MAG: SprT-like domain-containing protein [Bacteroidaceae bacterium]|nr:SprT-like domain-containing protein [Bacteroidaceae bacterium]